MTDEIELLRTAFGPDEVPSVTARERARTALRERAAPQPVRARTAVRRRWALRVGLAGAVTAAAVVAVVTVENANTVTRHDGRSRPVIAALPFARPASATELLENAAWAAARKPWTTPRPDQFMYKESRTLRNTEALQRRAPNGPLVPGRTRLVTEQSWNRIDGQVMARMDGGRLVVERQSRQLSWVFEPYEDLAGLTTVDKVLAWSRAPKGVGVDLDALLGQYVLPPAVEAAVFRALARGDDTRLIPDAVNIDGRPAVALRLAVEGYLSKELLFDRQTYALIGERLVATADHRNVGDDGTSTTRKGDLFRQVTYTASRIVDEPGDTR